MSKEYKIKEEENLHYEQRSLETTPNGENRIIMKKIILIILLLLVGLQKSFSCDINVDSLFQQHFLSLDTTVVCGESKLILPVDIKFVYLVGILSDISFEIHSYSGHPILTVNNVMDFKKWYLRNKHKINCEKVEKALFLLEVGLTEEVEKEIKKLKID
ncbi:MAG: hypothetical protein LBT56_08215 [Prevotellaceae bacterium]|jgi:hypothetical protein|nr:hypothetical protein [Prevotellaceae bacterium]